MVSILKSKGFASLDLLRGIAAWCVALPHFYLFSNSESNKLEFFSVIAVEIFFILSGFVLGRQLDLCFKNKNFITLKIFFLRRWLRTIPIYIVLLVLPNTVFH